MARSSTKPTDTGKKGRGHGLGRRERAYNQAMPNPKNVENTSPKTHVSFMSQELNNYQNVQQNQTNVEVMAHA